MPRDFEPLFDIPESMSMTIGATKIGQSVQLVVQYEVVERTKSFIVLRVHSLYAEKSKRSF